MKTIAIIAAALLALCLGMIMHLSGAHAQVLQIPCGPEKMLLEGLSKSSQEFVVMSGELISGKRIIVTASSAGTFSILESDGNIACMVAVGEKVELDKGI